MEDLKKCAKFAKEEKKMMEEELWIVGRLLDHVILKFRTS